MSNSSLYEWVCFGKGVFVAKNQYSGQTGGYYSYDGINWTSSNFPEDFGASACCFGNGKFVAVENSGGRTCYSTDGINWTLRESIGRNYLSGIAYGNGLFVVTVGYNTSSDSIYYSLDGTKNWTRLTLPVTTRWGTIVYGKDKFVIAPSMLLGTTNNVLYGNISNNDITFYSSTLPKAAQWQAMAYGNGIYVIVAYNSGDVAYSYDGVNWNLSALPYSSKVLGGVNRPLIHDGKKLYFLVLIRNTKFFIV